MLKKWGPTGKSLFYKSVLLLWAALEPIGYRIIFQKIQYSTRSILQYRHISHWIFEDRKLINKGFTPYQGQTENPHLNKHDVLNCEGIIG